METRDEFKNTEMEESFWEKQIEREIQIEESAKSKILDNEQKKKRSWKKLEVEKLKRKERRKEGRTRTDKCKK